MYYVAGVLAILVLAEAWLLWRVWIAMRTMHEVTGQLVRVDRALQLLTETAETGFATFAGVLSHSLQPVSALPEMIAAGESVPTPVPNPAPYAGPAPARFERY